MVNYGQGGFTVSLLWAYAQRSPFLSIVCLDVNKDGYEDLIVLGNIFERELETLCYDGGNGTVLVSNTYDAYTAQLPMQPGLFIEDNAKSLLQLGQQGVAKQLLLGRVNNAQIQLVEANIKSCIYLSI